VRSLPRSLPLVLACLAALAFAGCEGKLRKKGEPSAAAGRNISEEEAWEAYGSDEAAAGYSTESARTEAMEAKAAELQRQYEDALANARTDEERARAFQDFESGRAELNRMAEDDGGAGDEYAPPP
jgi:hypothetical protein